ncbi:MAG: septum formation initiator family protein [Patescibacteria group bacterium]
MKYIIITIIIIGILALGFALYNLYCQKLDLENDLAKINTELNPLIKENGQLMADVEYFRDQENLEKELRAKFNYALPGEEMVIIVPKEQ